MQSASPPPTPDKLARARLFVFTGWITLPVCDWVWLLALADQQGQALEAYLAHVLHEHAQTHAKEQQLS